MASGYTRAGARGGAGPQGTMAARSRPRTAASLAAGARRGTLLGLGSSRISCVRPSFQRLPHAITVRVYPRTEHAAGLEPGTTG